MHRIILVTGMAVFMLSPVSLVSQAHGRSSRLASEARIDQAHGRVPASATPAKQSANPKATPEGVTSGGGAAAGSPSTPVTCNQQNASSPACYSATQSARPVGK